MNTNNSKPEEEMPPSADDPAYAHALEAQRQRELGAAFAHRCLTVALWEAAGLFLALAVIAWLGWQNAHPPVKYFSTENGRIIPVKPLDVPGFSQQDVAAFGTDTLQESFSLDFVHYRKQMSRVQDRYSESGFGGYFKALTASNVFEQVTKRRMNLSISVEPGVVVRRGQEGGRYAWEFQYPVTLKLDGQQESGLPQRFIFTLRIQQTDVRTKPAGLEVTQVISTNAS